MPRQLTIPTQEMGDLELYLIYKHGCAFEPEWSGLEQAPAIVALLTLVSKEDMTHALAGWSRPLVRALGIPPEGALRKLPSNICWSMKTCPFYRVKDCHPIAKGMPWCFTPSSVENEVARTLSAELIKLWRVGVYTVIVQDSG
jgi:hypothetical protein